MTTFSIGQVQVVITPEQDALGRIAEEVASKLSSLTPHDPQSGGREAVVAVILDGLRQAQSEIIRKAL